MKLKILVSSLVALGLASTVANAETTMTTKHVVKKPVILQKAAPAIVPGASETTTTAASLQSLQSQIDALQAIVNRNQDNAVSDPTKILGSNWYNFLTISGEFKPVYAWNNRQLTPSNEHSTENDNRRTAAISKGQNTNAYMGAMALYLDGQVNDFTAIHTALEYGYNPDKFSSSRTSAPSTEMYFSEANIKFANFAQSPLYAVLGKQYFNFGQTGHDSISTPFTQIMSQTEGVGATAGYVTSNGFNASTYALNGDLASRSNAAPATAADGGTTRANQLRTWGASVGYTAPSQTLGVIAQLDYINNLAQTVYMSHAIVDSHLRSSSNTAQMQTFGQRTPGYAAHLVLSSGPFSLLWDYTAALRAFSPDDLYANNPNTGARPTASFTQLDYAFTNNGHANTVYTAYQTTSQAQQIYGADLGGFVLPQKRWLAGYKYGVVKNVTLNLELDRDHDYRADGSNLNSNGAMFGVDVVF